MFVKFVLSAACLFTGATMLAPAAHAGHGIAPHFLRVVAGEQGGSEAERELIAGAETGTIMPTSTSPYAFAATRYGVPRYVPSRLVGTGLVR